MFWWVIKSFICSCLPHPGFWSEGEITNLWRGFQGSKWLCCHLQVRSVYMRQCKGLRELSASCLWKMCSTTELYLELSVAVLKYVVSTYQLCCCFLFYFGRFDSQTLWCSFSTYSRFCAQGSQPAVLGRPYM